MTQGFNTIREMCNKNPLLLDGDSADYLISYIEFKNRNVSKAAKSLLNLFREINPMLLHKKLRGQEWRENGCKTGFEDEMKFGKEKIYDKIEGAELLP